MAKKSTTTGEIKKYTCALPVTHDGEAYAPGEPIELTAEMAAPLLAVQAIEEPKAKAAEEPKS